MFTSHAVNKTYQIDGMRVFKYNILGRILKPRRIQDKKVLNLGNPNNAVVLPESTVVTGFVLMQSCPQDPQTLCNYGRNYHCHLSRIFSRLVMEEVHNKGGFPGDLKGSNSKK